MVNAKVALFHINGSVSTKFYPKEKAFRKLTAHSPVSMQRYILWKTLEFSLKGYKKCIAAVSIMTL